MRKKFAGNLLLLIFANVLIKPFWIFGIDRVVQNRIGLAEYGTYLALFNFSFLFGIVLDFGLSNFNNRAVARHPSRLASYLPGDQTRIIFAIFPYSVRLRCPNRLFNSSNQIARLSGYQSGTTILYTLSSFKLDCPSFI